MASQADPHQCHAIGIHLGTTYRIIRHDFEWHFVIATEDHARILMQRAAMTRIVKDEKVIAALYRLTNGPEVQFLARHLSRRIAQGWNGARQYYPRGSNGSAGSCLSQNNPHNTCQTISVQKWMPTG